MSWLEDITKWSTRYFLASSSTEIRKVPTIPSRHRQRALRPSERSGMDGKTTLVKMSAILGFFGLVAARTASVYLLMAGAAPCKAKGKAHRGWFDFFALLLPSRLVNRTYRELHRKDWNRTVKMEWQRRWQNGWKASLHWSDPIKSCSILTSRFMLFDRCFCCCCGVRK